MMQGILPSVAYSPALLGILAPKQTGPSMGGKNPAAATPPVQSRPRVSGWRVLDRVLGGETISQGLDAERERLRTEAMRPQQMQRRAEALARIQDPRERALFEGIGSEAWQQAASQVFRPRTLAPGSIERLGGETVGAAPVVERFEDRFGFFDPLNPAAGARYTERRGATRGEETDVLKAQTAEMAARFANVSPNTNVVDLRAPGGPSEVYAGYRPPDVVSLAPGAEAAVIQNGAETGRIASTQARPMSDADQRAVAEADQRLAAIDLANTRAAVIEQQIATGQLNLGPMTNAISQGRLAIGRADQNALNYDALLQWAREARNAVLQANTGVQTDQDAIRELDTILSGVTDERAVTAALRRYREARTATADVLRRDIARRSNAPAPQSGPVTVNSPAEAAALPPGTRYRTPQGQEFIR
jgi:hypothetical protein